MDTTRTLAPQTVAAVPHLAAQPPVTGTKVPATRASGGPATLPANKVFIAQVVSARLSGTAFPENPGEIAPPERTLRPYDVPMLPYHDAPAHAENAQDDVGAAAPDDTPG